jgi:aryl-alcohol dehydrogenase-like predicted oxidoreductase
MRYRKFGRTGLLVSELCLGTMTFGGEDGVWGQIGNLKQAEADGLIGRSLDAGINFIDTADVYSDGRSELITGQALINLRVPRENVVVATKVFGESGSNWAAWQIMKALGISERLGLARFESLQAYYTIAGRDLERELVPLLLSEGVGLLVWSPLAGGLLSGKFGRDVKAEAGSRRAAFDFPPVNVERAYDCIDAMRTAAQARGVSVAQIAIAWLLHQRAVTSVIIGARRVAQLDDNIAATAIKLSADELHMLDKVSALPAEYPGWMLERLGAFRRQQLAQSDGVQGS